MKDRTNRTEGVYALAWVFAGLATAMALAYVIFICTELSSIEDGYTALRSRMSKAPGELIAGTVGVCLSFSATMFMFATFREQRKQFGELRNDSARNRFESTYFNMFNTFYNIRKNINEDLSEASENKRYNLHDYYEGFRWFYRSHNGTREGKEVAAYLNQKSLNRVECEKVEQYTAELFETYVTESGYDIDYYFRFVFNTIDFVVRNWENAPDATRKISHYLGIFQSQMSNDELALIFYYAISHHGVDKDYKYLFRSYMDKYGFLENISEGTLLHRTHHMMYPATQFRFLGRNERTPKQP